MKLSTFYNIFYKHRIKKAKFFNRIYLLTKIMLYFFYVITFIEKKISILKLRSFKYATSYAFRFYFKNSTVYSADLYPDLQKFFSLDIKKKNKEYFLKTFNLLKFIKVELIKLLLLKTNEI